MQMQKSQFEWGIWIKGLEQELSVINWLVNLNAGIGLKVEAVNILKIAVTDLLFSLKYQVMNFMIEYINLARVNIARFNELRIQILCWMYHGQPVARR